MKKILFILMAAILAKFGEAQDTAPAVLIERASADYICLELPDMANPTASGAALKAAAKRARLAQLQDDYLADRLCPRRLEYVSPWSYFGSRKRLLEKGAQRDAWKAYYVELAAFYKSQSKTKE